MTDKVDDLLRELEKVRTAISNLDRHYDRETAEKHYRRLSMKEDEILDEIKKQEDNV